MSTDMAQADRSRVASADRRTARPEKHEARPITAAQVMSRRYATVDADTSLFGAWGRLHKDHERLLVVINQGVRPIGVLDEEDLALEWPAGPRAAHHLPIRKLLRYRIPATVRESDDMASVARTMLASRNNAVPVVDEDGRLLGLITVWHCIELLATRHTNPRPAPPS